MVCKKCGKEIPENATVCPKCGETAVLKKGMPVAVKVILILLAVGLLIGIISGIAYDPVKSVKNGYFAGERSASVGEILDLAIDNAKWYDTSEGGNTLVCCDGVWLGESLHIELVKEDGNVYYFSDRIKVNGKGVSESEAKELISSIILFYKAETM